MFDEQNLLIEDGTDINEIFWKTLLNISSSGERERDRERERERERERDSVLNAFQFFVWMCCRFFFL